ncbi:MAG: nickel/cobalt transporter (NicO) family protein [Actinomycetota bacterium]|nr:nickel/cobalt transporter (NicO) family protein [Actinomycetota bacterium]
MTRWRRSIATGFLAVVIVLVTAVVAQAHPLGNFTVNRFSGLEFTKQGVTDHYVVDMAEIPTYQELSRLDPSHKEKPSAQSLHAYADSLGRRISTGVTMTADGHNVALTFSGSAASLRPGQGGLKIMRIEVSLRGSLPSPNAVIHYTDTNFGDRIGWKEIIAYGSGGEGVLSASVPAKSVSQELRAYPKSMLASPVDVTEATVKLQPGALGTSTGPVGGLTVSSPGAIGGSLATEFARLIEHRLSPLFLLAALLLALGAGALHALGPGHGKSIMAAYLVGSEGKVRQAVTVGVAVSLMHTASVGALGLAILGASKLFAPEVVFPWLSLLSALVVLALGTYLLRSRLRARAHARAHGLAEPHTHALQELPASHDHHHGQHDHPHDLGQDHPDDLGHDHHSGHGHDHGHDHSHDHGHSHSHAPAPGITPTSWKGLGVIALSGGLLPSPSALIVLLAAVALHRIAFGLVLVGVFSVGLAAALTVVGVLVIKARTYATRRWGENLTNALPIFSAAAILLIGVFLTAGAVAKL